MPDSGERTGDRRRRGFDLVSSRRRNAAQAQHPADGVDEAGAVEREEVEVIDTLTLRDDETIGRQQGDVAFVAKIEYKTGRSLAPRKRGPKAKE